ncbi:SDR family NAD(P)-dependent oxidoreductase [Micromonospora sp. NBC_00421]|uniref:SDR family NAD(P)-dependent oxidoreductase n=1 Tax=Micromonospora sp. NBC_00421 TaxID=2975976 RepID=UPI002E1EA81D
MTGAVDLGQWLRGRVLFVTGASAGIGRTTATVAARSGMKVVVAARRADECQRLVKEIVSTGGDAVHAVVDVTDEEQVAAAIRLAVSTYGRLDCAFNNAGVSGDGRIVDLDASMFDRVMNVNARGLLLCMQHELRQMRAQGTGTIVNNISVHGFRNAFPGVGAYAASKHAAVALTRAAAIENAEIGLRVNAVAPGPIDTEMFRSSTATNPVAARWPRLIPAGRVGTPDEVTVTVMYLLSDLSSYVNGQIIGVDGGFLAL